MEDQRADDSVFPTRGPLSVTSIMPHVFTHLLPTPHDVDLTGTTAVVIDVLRATTTIVTALAHGARHVLPVGDVQRAREMAIREGGSDLLMGGERGGERIPGFMLDNSPLRYHGSAVSGKRIVFTTSHGTRAIEWASRGRQVLIAAFANLTAVVHELASLNEAIHLVCSGTDNGPSIEDSLCAAAIAGKLWESRGRPPWQDDTTIALLELYQRGSWADPVERLRLLSAGRGGRRLSGLGFEEDIHYAAEIDRFRIVPRLDRRYVPPRIVV